MTLFPRLALSLALAAAGLAWAAYTLAAGPLPAPLAALALGLASAASLALHMTPRRRRLFAIRAAVHTGALAVAVAAAWVHLVQPLQATASLDGLLRAAAAGGTVALILLPAAPLAGLLAAWFCLDTLLTLPHALRGRGRKRAESELHGASRLLARRHLHRLARAPGPILGQAGRRTGAPLVAWPLEGSALTLAPPRTGKGALIALNLLAPNNRGLAGPTVTIDPRGELWCVAARRRRELGRQPILLDPFGLVQDHEAAFGERLHLPDTVGATYNPLDFIRDDDAHAVRDINVLLDALLTPPPDGAHQNSRHFYESARAIVAGYIADFGSSGRRFQ